MYTLFARLGYTLAVEGELPKAFERKTWNRPVSGVLITTVLSLLLANLVDLASIAIMGSAGFLLIFAVVNAAACRLARELHSSRLICALGCGACAVALVILLYQTYESTPSACFVFFGIVGSAFVFEVFYPRIAARKLNLGPVGRRSSKASGGDG